MRLAVIAIAITICGSVLLVPDTCAGSELSEVCHRLTIYRPSSLWAQGQAIGGRSLTDRRIEWPSWETWWRVLSLRDYNTRVVVIGTTLLGFAAGTIGSFTLLRRRALMGDALSHATLPGIGMAFILAPFFGLPGKSLPVLLFGAAVTGTLGMLAILLIRNLTRLKEDAALGIVLSVFFGGGVAILGVIQQMPAGHSAGLEAFIYGKTASMISSDAWLIAIAGTLCQITCVLFYKELKLVCFDESYAGSRGFPVVALDLLLMVLVTIVTIIGLQAVGLILMIALLVIPAAAARFWTEQMTWMTVFAALIGGGSCLVGAAMSAILPRLPSGAMIVLVSAFAFEISMFFGVSRGVLIRGHRRRRLNRKIDHQHLLRGLYEHAERGDEQHRDQPIPWQTVLSMRSWGKNRLTRCLRRAAKEGLVTVGADRSLLLTPAGFERASQLVHEHRLWEMYLITHADVAPSKVDRDADAIEHVLDREMIEKLETLLMRRRTVEGVPDDPHGAFANASAESPNQTEQRS
ncbi:iron chelate uptake ABC transporter family permease subunit [Planctomycetaceae bacterium SH139]